MCLPDTMQSFRTVRRMALAMVIAVLWGAAPTRAAQVNTIEVVDDDKSFRIVFDGVVDAPVLRVRAVLSDYARLGNLNPIIKVLSVESAPAGPGKRVRSTIETCIWFFCRHLVQVEDVTEPDPGTIAARIVPGAGDFESGSSIWRITGEGDGTRLHYEATRVAAFWIPPLLGPWAIRRSMREQFEASIVALERYANQ